MPSISCDLFKYILRRAVQPNHQGPFYSHYIRIHPVKVQIKYKDMLSKTPEL